MTDPAPVVLVAHGSRDPNSAATMRRLARAVAARWAAPVTTAFLDFNLPGVAPVLRGLAVGDAPAPIVVPALLTRAYHGKVDVPAVLAGAGVPAMLTAVLGPAEPGEAPDPLLIAALRRRLDELAVEYDGVVLMAAGTRDPVARSTVDEVAAELGRALGVPCVAGFASGPARTGAEATTRVRSLGARRVVASSYFLAPGRLFAAIADSVHGAGVLHVARPLGSAPELVDLVLQRATPITH